MSYVTTVLVLAPYAPDAVRQRITNESWDAEREYDRLGDLNEYRGDRGANPTDWWGGSKFGPGEVYGGGFNHWNEEAFLGWIRSLPWGNVSGQVTVTWIGEGDYEDASWGRSADPAWHFASVTQIKTA